jgi:hypothetical protein
MEVHDLIRINRVFRSPLYELRVRDSRISPIGSAAALAGLIDRRGPVLQKTCEDARFDGSKSFGPAPLRRTIGLFPRSEGNGRQAWPQRYEQTGDAVTRFHG